MFAVAVEYGLDIRVKFGAFRSNRFRDIQATHFVMDDDERRTTPADAGHYTNQNVKLSFYVKKIDRRNLTSFFND